MKRGKKRSRKRIILIEAGILAALFLAAVVIFSFFTNRKDGATTDMEAASYPQVSFSYAGYELNLLPGYAKEMSLTDMRDTITPVSNARLEMKLSEEETIQSMEAVIYTLDGTEELARETVDNPGADVNLAFGDGTVLDEERILAIILSVGEDEKRYYYTRVVDSSDKNIVECLDFIKEFHDNALAKTDSSSISASIEPDETGDNTTFGHVTIHSDYAHVTWGEMSPTVIGSEMWMIKEMNSVTSSVQLQYRVRCAGDENEEETYKVKEFFRVRYQSDKKQTLLLDYDRTADQIFNAGQAALDEKGILLGIGDEDVPYLASKDGTKVSFVQADELWNYDGGSGELSQVFSFAPEENTDSRNWVSQHKISLLNIDNKGNTAFAVFGYMNRGEHEGEVGAAIYYYDHAENLLEERLFLSTDQSYGRAIIQLGDLMCYSAGRDVLYTLSDGTLYQITAGKNRVRELQTDLQDGAYAVSGDGKYIAYQNGSGEQKASEIQVLDLSSGDSRTLLCEEGEEIWPLGFMESDFVYGVSRQSDSGQMISGENVKPMYKLEIQNSKGEILKTYEQDHIYILGASFEKNMITLNRAVKEGTRYSAAEEDYITNNDAVSESKVYIEAYSTDLKGKQVRITIGDGIEDPDTKVLEPEQELDEDPKTFTLEPEEGKKQFYVYGCGELQAVCTRAGEAVILADRYNGIVVDSAQGYVWERGNRDLKYTITGQDALLAQMRTALTSGASPMEAAGQAEDREGLDLTGCTPEELMYIVNQDRPVIAMLNAQKSVIIIGYSETTLTYMDTESGATKSVSLEKMDKMTEGTGHMYIG